MGQGNDFYGEQNSPDQEDNGMDYSLGPPRIPVRQLPPNAWQLYNRQMIDISDMSRDHLARVIALLNRWAAGAAIEEALSSIKSFGLFEHGDGATMAFEQELEALGSQPPSDYARKHVPPYAAMERRLRQLGALRPAKPLKQQKGQQMLHKTGMLVGMHFRGELVKALVSRLPPGTALLLVPDPENEYDTTGKATKVMVDGHEVTLELEAGDLQSLEILAEGSGIDMAEWLSAPIFLGFLANSAKTVPEGYASAADITDAIRVARLVNGLDFTPDSPGSAILGLAADGKPTVTLA